MVRKLLVVAVAFVVAVSAVNAAMAQDRNDLQVAYAGTLSTWDPHTGRHGTEHQVLWALFDSLIRFNDSLELVPGLAESWEFTGPTTFVLHLRPGLTFHDGTALDAAAVKWNLDRQKDPATGAATAAEIEPITSVEAVDATTVRIELAYPMASLPSMFTDRAGMMMSPAAAEHYGADIGQHPVGAGPYQFVEWVADSHWTLERFDDFWEQGVPAIEKITFQHFQNATVAMQALRAGQIDFFQDVPADDMPWVEQNPDYDLLTDPTLKFYMLYVNAVGDPFNNVALRQAVAYSLDRATLAQIFGGAAAQATNGMFPEGYWAKDSDVTFYPYDPEMVTKKLEEARATGYDGSPVRLLVYTAGIYSDFGEAIQGMMTNAGINAEITIGDNTAMSKLFEEGGGSLKLSSWTGRLDPDQTSSLLLHSDGGYHYPRGAYVGEFQDVELDALIESARQTYDNAERRDLYSDVQREMTEEVYAIPLFFVPWNTAMRDGLTMEPNLLGKPLFRTFAWQ